MAFNTGLTYETYSITNPTTHPNKMSQTNDNNKTFQINIDKTHSNN